jgi:hypothetical protein
MAKLFARLGQTAAQVLSNKDLAHRIARLHIADVVFPSPDLAGDAAGYTAEGGQAVEVVAQ